jgi:hypothetical protein
MYTGGSTDVNELKSASPLYIRVAVSGDTKSDSRDREQLYGLE